ncbi:MAG: site-2 protease family protein [Actinobacteria bacterium]|nr:MAG: site-2 protease family protein [Actinomycetota bacterium]
MSSMIALGNFTALGFRLAVYMLASLLVGMALREYVRSRTAMSLGDATPRLWGRLTWKPASWFDPFGSGVLPGLIAVLWTVQALLIPAAYGKPAPIDPSRFHRRVRDVIIVSAAGPIATLALGVAAGLAVRVSGPSAEPYRIMLTLCYTSMSLTVFHLLPIPGLDGARMLALALPPDAAQAYRNFDRYLPLIVLVILFVFSSLAVGFLTTLAGALCDSATGVHCQLLLQF